MAMAICVAIATLDNLIRYDSLSALAMLQRPGLAWECVAVVLALGVILGLGLGFDTCGVWSC